MHMLKEFDDVDAAPFEDCPGLQRYFVAFEVGKLLLDGLVSAGQEACAHSVSFWPKTQVEACGLELGPLQILVRSQELPVDEFVNSLTRQEAGLAGELLGSRPAQASEIG